MSLPFKHVLVTGGCGFIGSHLIRHLLDDPAFTGKVINLDALTYAGNPRNLEDVAANHPERYHLVHGDICDTSLVERIFGTHAVDAVVHLAAESHVDRSIVAPDAFVRTNVEGTLVLLQTARKAWSQGTGPFRFHHVSTDEVFGSLGPEGFFDEDTPYDPRSPYSASKAASDHLVRAFHHTYGLPVTLSNCSNNYGPFHFPEKLIPLMILNALDGRELPVYGDGGNIRDWLHVSDHCRAILAILAQGRTGRTYCVGGSCEQNNLEVVRRITDLLEMVRPAQSNPNLPPGSRYADLIRFVGDRPGHDRRYAIDASRIRGELGWTPRYRFEEGLRETILWYLDHPSWVEEVRSGAYRSWLEHNYSNRT